MPKQLVSRKPYVFELAAPASMLEQGSIDGYCVGEPWNALACAYGAGRMLVVSSDVWPSAPEKVLALPTIDWMREGAHVAPWVLEDATMPIPMADDRFVDGTVFDPRDVVEYLESLEIASLRIRLDELAGPF